MPREQGTQDVPDDGTATLSPHELRLQALLTTLHARTIDESLAWEVDDAAADSYCVVGKKGWMVATRSIDGDGVAPYALVVADSDGEAILEVSSRSPFARPLGDLFGRLHSAAAATAWLSGASSFLGGIVADLASPAESPAETPPVPDKRQARRRVRKSSARQPMP